MTANKRHKPEQETKKRATTKCAMKLLKTVRAISIIL